MGCAGKAARAQLLPQPGQILLVRGTTGALVVLAGLVPGTGRAPGWYRGPRRVTLANSESHVLRATGAKTSESHSLFFYYYVLAINLGADCKHLSPNTDHR